MKYIVMQSGITDELSREDIITFPDEIVHRDMAKFVGHMYRKEYKLFPIVISAGFVNMISSECYGESESLNKKSRPDRDSQLLIAGKYGMNIINKVDI